MNPNESPLIPQGSFLEQKNKGRARVKIAVFVVLAIHGVGLMALLMQGCKPSTTGNETTLKDTNLLSEVGSNSFPVLDDTNTVSSIIPTNNPTPPEMVNNVVTNVVPEPTITATEHKIVKGDSFAKLAQDHHVTLNAIREANPGVDPAKLQIGQTIKIPAPTTVVVSPGAVSPTAANGGSSYTVKSGDTLIKIASQFGVTVKAIRTVNNLTTDKIRVGQNLKIPAKAAAQTPTTTPQHTAGTSAAGSR
jgi:LysM repeat protein